MTIEKGTLLFKRTDPETPGAYETKRYNWEFGQEAGHHVWQTEAEENANGWMLRLQPDYDTATHYLDKKDTDSGVNVYQGLIAYAAEEIFNGKVTKFRNSVQIHLDSLAQSWGYDNIISLCSYDGNSDLQYSAEGTAGKNWRSEVWRYCETELDKIGIGTRPEPESVEAFILELPTIARP